MSFAQIPHFDNWWDVKIYDSGEDKYYHEQGHGLIQTFNTALKKIPLDTNPE